ncbi:MAG: VOC family protein [Isosphaeraceae bacterium]
MSQPTKPQAGSIAWVDLTVPDAGESKQFYCHVVGWSASEVDMGGYSDYCMNVSEGGKTVAGVCHARGVNAELPPLWLVYFTVADLDQSMKSAVALGGRILTGPKGMGNHVRSCVIADPSGATVALFEPAE